MRFVLLVMAFGFFSNIVSAQINLNKLKNVAAKTQQVINARGLSQDEVVKGLKEALIVGTTASTANASKEGGFNNNQIIKIPFPKDAEKMKSTLIKVGLQSQVSKFEYVLNEAAEDASNFAKEIFIYPSLTPTKKFSKL